MAIDPDVTESSGIADNQQALFNVLVTEAIDTDEMRQSLGQAHGIVIDAQDTQGPTGLSRIATRLVTQDIARKARAISVATRRIDLEPDVGRFLLVCAGIRDVPGDAAALMQVVHELLPKPDSRAHIESTTASAGAFLKLAGELACFLYYAATVLDFFDESAAKTRWHDTSALHLLAQARQAFSTSTRVAWEGISSFRCSWDMAAVAFPSALEPTPATTHSR